MRLEVECQDVCSCKLSIIKEIRKWQDELTNDIVDEIIYETLDSVIDLVINEV